MALPIDPCKLASDVIIPELKKISQDLEARVASLGVPVRAADDLLAEANSKIKTIISDLQTGLNTSLSVINAAIDKLKTILNLLIGIIEGNPLMLLAALIYPMIAAIGLAGSTGMIVAQAIVIVFGIGAAYNLISVFL